MQTRTLYALIGAALLTMTGAGLAQSDTNATSEPTSPSEPTFFLKTSPGEARMKPGETATVTVVAESRAEQRISLSVRAQDGIEATLGSDFLDIVPGAAARTALTIVAPGNATRSPYYVVVIATSADGSMRDAKVVIHLRDAPAKSTERPVEKERPTPTRSSEPRSHEPKPEGAARPEPAGFEKRYDVLERRFVALLERLDRIEKRLDTLDERATRPQPKPAPQPAGVRMTLSPEHAILGAEGGKVALLLMGGEKDARIPFALRFNETSGWRASLEQDVVYVPAHQRAWVWIDLHAEPGAGALEYAVVQKDDAPGPSVTKGTAVARMP